MHPWTASQRVAVVGLTAGILLLAGWRYGRNRVAISDPQPAHPLHEMDLADRIDPNTADASTLAVLPLIGPKRAQEIVAYRDRFTAEHPGQLAFRRSRDLMRIKGVGLTTMEQLESYLTFPESQPSTQEP